MKLRTPRDFVTIVLLTLAVFCVSLGVGSGPVFLLIFGATIIAVLAWIGTRRLYRTALAELYEKHGNQQSFNPTSDTAADGPGLEAPGLSDVINRYHSRPLPTVPRREARRETRRENPREARLDSRQEPRLSPSRPTAKASPSTDQALAEMAQQLEAALRKPVAKADRNETREKPLNEQQLEQAICKLATTAARTT